MPWQATGTAGESGDVFRVELPERLELQAPGE